VMKLAPGVLSILVCLLLPILEEVFGAIYKMELFFKVIFKIF
jgi:hypothetical protein